MKKAQLGFKYISLDDEFRIPDLEDIEDARISRAMTVHQKEKLRKLRNYHKHRDEYNDQKRSVARSVAGRYEESKRKSLKENISWEFTREAWEKMWLDAGYVVKPGTQTEQNPKGEVVHAWALRGAHRYNNTCMVRKDLNLGWSPENSMVVFRGEELVPGSRWYQSAP